MILMLTIMTMFRFNWHERDTWRTVASLCRQPVHVAGSYLFSHQQPSVLRTPTPTSHNCHIPTPARPRIVTGHPQWSDANSDFQLHRGQPNLAVARPRLATSPRRRHRGIDSGSAAVPEICRPHSGPVRRKPTSSWRCSESARSLRVW